MTPSIRVQWMLEYLRKIEERITFQRSGEYTPMDMNILGDRLRWLSDEAYQRASEKEREAA